MQSNFKVIKVYCKGPIRFWIICGPKKCSQWVSIHEKNNVKMKAWPSQKKNCLQAIFFIGVFQEVISARRLFKKSFFQWGFVFKTLQRYLWLISLKYMALGAKLHKYLSAFPK